jgi:hypothetical protein
MRGLKSAGYWALVVGLMVVFSAAALLLFIVPYLILGAKVISPG